MSSLNQSNPYSNSISEKNYNGYYVTLHNAKVLKEAIENGTAPFLPDPDGNVKTKAIYNGNTGYCLNAKELIPAQLKAKENENVVVTYNTVTKAKSKVIAGEKGITFNFKREDGTYGTSQLFFPSQTEHPDKIIEHTEPKIKKNGNYSLDKSIEIISSAPEEYLANYVAACKSGAKLTVKPEIAEEFKKNFIPVLENQLSKKVDRNQDMDSLSNFMFKVDLKANSINKELFSENKKENQIKKSIENKKEIEIERD